MSTDFFMHQLLVLSLCLQSSAPGAETSILSKKKGESSAGVLSDVYPNFPRLLKSAESGCGFCGLLRFALQAKYSDEEVDEAERMWDKAIRDSWPTRGDGYQVSIWASRLADEGESMIHEPRSGPELFSISKCPYPPGQPRRVPGLNAQDYLWFRIYAEIDNKASEQIHRLLPSEKPLSKSNIYRIIDWIRECSDTHFKCYHGNGHRYPARLIDVGSSDGSQKPCLVLTNHWNWTSVRYAALSHCWGSPRPAILGSYPRTLRENVQQLINGIDIRLLPQNFQDAIVVARTLQIQYVWIDALCIIQDDRADWAREAALMGTIYSNSYLTIVATSATSSTDGFLGRSSLPTVSMPYHQENDFSCTEGQYYMANWPTGNEGSWHQAVTTSPWMSRAWTYQEHLLSRRVIHFTLRKLFWECRTMDTLEENETSRRPDYATPWVKINDVHDEAQASNAQDVGFGAPYNEWYELVSGYTLRHLTYDEDIFPALAGLAQNFADQSFTNRYAEDYIAGLWRKDIFRGILWMTHDSSLTRRPSQYLAPSWSWASLKGHVHWPDWTAFGQVHTQAELVRCETRMVDGRMEATLLGSLTIRARVRQSIQIAKASEMQVALRFAFNLLIDGNVIDDGTLDTDDIDIGSADVCLLQVLAQKEAESYYGYRPTALLICPILGSKKQFRRIGCATLDEDSRDLFQRCNSEEIVLL